MRKIGLSWFADPPHLGFEHIDINVRRRQHHRPQLADGWFVCRDLDLAKSLDCHPVTHGMREDVDCIGVAPKDHTQSMLEFIARRRRAVGIVDIISQVSPRSPV